MQGGPRKTSDGTIPLNWRIQSVAMYVIYYDEINDYIFHDVEDSHNDFNKTKFNK